MEKKIYSLMFILTLTIMFSSKNNFAEKISKDMDNLLKKNYTIKFDELLGKGGSGEIWGSSSSNIAIKTGKNKRACEIIQKEFKIQQQIYDTIVKINHGLLNRLKILNPKKIIFNSKSDICAMELPRLYPIKEEKYKNIITQIRLGEETMDRLEKGNEIIKGHQIGFKEINNIVVKYDKINKGKKNIEQLFSDIGTFLGMLHYKIKLDGLDTEVCLVRSTKESKKYEIFFIDFGMCNKISYKTTKQKQKSIDKIITALNVETIFPNPTNKNFKYFMNSYIDIAKNENLEKTAQKVINEFIKEQYLRNIIIKEYLIDKLKINKRGIFQLRGYSKIISSWIGDQLVQEIKNNNYNQNKKDIKIYLEKLLLNKSIKLKKNKSINKLEKSLLNKIFKNYNNEI